MIFLFYWVVFQVEAMSKHWSISVQILTSNIAIGFEVLCIIGKWVLVSRRPYDRSAALGVNRKSLNASSAFFPRQGDHNYDDGQKLQVICIWTGDDGIAHKKNSFAFLRVVHLLSFLEHNQDVVCVRGN